MSTKRWRMSVMELGSDSNVEEVTIEADNWMTALRLGRTSMGESGGVPTGSSCAVAADGQVTILDPIDRRRFVLQVDSSASYRPPAVMPAKIPSDPVPSAQPASPAPKPAAPAAIPKPVSPLAPAVPTPASTPAPVAASPVAASPDAASPVATGGPAPKRKRARTMAYIPDAPGPQAPPKSALKSTSAYQAPTPDMVRRASAPPQSSAPAPQPPDGGDITGLEATVAVSAADLNIDGPPKATVPNAIMIAEAQAKAEAKAQEALEATAKAEAEAQAKAEAEAQAKAEAEAQVEAARLEREAAEAAAKLPNDDDAGQVGGVSWKLLHRRDSDPSDTSPLTYRERSYVVDPGTSEADAEAVAIARAVSLMNLLADGPQGRFINVAVFDHSWTEQPNTPPVVTVAEKDWVDRVVEHPLRTAQQSAAPPPRKRATTNDQDRRLSDAFEACQDLLFVASPLEAVEFCHRLLGDLIPCAAITACLYDIDDNVHRVVAASGPGGEQRRGHAIPDNAGIFGAVTASGRPLIIQSDDARLDPEHDGREGLQIVNGLYLASAHNGRHLATIQLLNREAGDFTTADADLGYYIAQQLGEFLAKARASLRPGA